MNKIFRVITAVLAMLATASCMQWDYGKFEEDFDTADHGLFVVCEGNFQYGNATLSHYDPQRRSVQNEVFMRANGMKLGDVAQSMTVYGGKAWIVVNNSHVVFAINPDTFREVGRIEGLNSPRYIHFISDTKAYVSQLWDNRIYIVNPSTYSVTGTILVPEMEASTGSTEQMVQIGDYVYCSCWSYQSRIIKIDTRTDSVTTSLEIGRQPRCLVADSRGKLWTITDGGYEGSPAGREAPTLKCIDPQRFAVEKEFKFRATDSPSGLLASADGNTLYWINRHVWQMSVNATRLPVKPLLKERGTMYYALTVSPADNHLYVADAIDYQQQGKIYRYDTDGTLVDEFYVGITPGSFCWK